MGRAPFTEQPEPLWTVVDVFDFGDGYRDEPDDEVICPGCPVTGDPGSFLGAVNPQAGLGPSSRAGTSS